MEYIDWILGSLKPNSDVIGELRARYELFITPYKEMLSRPEQKALLDSLKEKLRTDKELRLVLVDTKSVFFLVINIITLCYF